MWKLLVLPVLLVATSARSSSVEDAMQQMAAIELSGTDGSLDLAKRALLSVRAWDEAFWLVRLRALDSAAAPEARRELAYVYLKTGRWGEAISYYRDLLTSGTGAEGDWQMLAYACGEAGDYQQATTAYLELLESADRYLEVERMPTSDPLPFALNLIVEARAAGRMAEVEPLVRRVHELLHQASESPTSRLRATRALEDLDGHGLE